MSGVFVPPRPQTLTLIQSQLVSSPVASVDFTSGIGSTYDDYLLRLDDLRLSADAELWLRVRSGGTFQADASDYAYNLRGINHAGADIGTRSTGAAQLLLTTAADADANRALYVTVGFAAPSNTVRVKQFKWDAAYVVSGGDRNEVTRADGGGWFYNGVVGTNNVPAINGVRVLASTGNIAGGRLSLYGVRHDA